MLKKHINYNGDTYYLDDNKDFHREGAPAIECTDGSWSWWDHGKIHREDGPALKNKDGVLSWYLEGRELEKGDFKDISMVEKMDAFDIFSVFELAGLADV